MSTDTAQHPPIFAALLAEEKGQTLGLTIYRYEWGGPVRNLARRIAKRERDTLPKPPRMRGALGILRDPISGYTLDEHSPYL